MRMIAFVVAFSSTLFGFWLGGVSFEVRHETLGWAYLASVAFGCLVATYPGFDK